jgi:hypothetical protein
MRLREFSTPKSAPKDAIKAKTIKRQQQKSADRDAHNRTPHNSPRIPASKTRTLQRA